MAAISETLTFQPLQMCRNMLIIRYGENLNISGKKKLIINRNNAEGCNFNFSVILFTVHGCLLMSCREVDAYNRGS